MKVTITYIQLKSPFKFFMLSYQAMKILKQLNGTNYLKLKKRGFLTRHYTMTLWENEKDLKDFAASGAHMEAMKTSRKLAREIRTYTYDAEELPDWKTAKSLLEQGQVITY